MFAADLSSFGTFIIFFSILGLFTSVLYYSKRRNAVKKPLIFAHILVILIVFFLIGFLLDYTGEQEKKYMYAINIPSDGAKSVLEKAIDSPCASYPSWYVKFRESTGWNSTDFWVVTGRSDKNITTICDPSVTGLFECTSNESKTLKDFRGGIIATCNSDMSCILIVYKESNAPLSPVRPAGC